MDFEKEKSDLLYEMKVTKGSRFNAAERMRRRDKRMTSVSSFASVYVIALTLIPTLFHVGETFSGILNIITIIFSLVILASSLLQYSNNDPVRAEQHHRCALEINAVRRELRAIANIDSAMLKSFGARFDDILHRYANNHEQVDFERYKLEHPLEYPGEPKEERKRAQKDIRVSEKAYAQLAVALMSVVMGITTAIATAYTFIQTKQADFIIQSIKRAIDGM